MEGTYYVFALLLAPMKLGEGVNIYIIGLVEGMHVKGRVHS